MMENDRLKQEVEELKKRKRASETTPPEKSLNNKGSAIE